MNDPLKNIPPEYFRIPLSVREVCIIKSKYCFPICPRCRSSLEREFQSFCDRCGQALSWKHFSF